MIAGVESILNGLPLTHNSDTPADMEPLIPNLLLFMESNLNVPPGVFMKEISIAEIIGNKCNT